MIVISEVFSVPSFQENLVFSKIDNSYYFARADPINQPTPNQIGNFQISLDKNSMTFPTESIRCLKRGCDSVCQGASPFLMRPNFKNYEQAEAVKQGENVKELMSVRGTLTQTQWM